MPNTSREFETPRTRQFRATGLNKQDDRTIGHIEEFGCSVVQGQDRIWTRMVVYGWRLDTAGNPEIITVGLPEKQRSSLERSHKAITIRRRSHAGSASRHRSKSNASLAG